MAEDEFEIDKSKLCVVEQCKGRLCHLFQVDLEVTFPIDLQNDGKSKIRLCATDDCESTSENIKMAKTYLQALTESGPYFVVNIETYQPDDFDMVRRNDDHIETMTQVVLEMFADSHQVRMRGQKSNVDKAKNLIAAILNQPNIDSDSCVDENDDKTSASPTMCCSSLHEDGDGGRNLDFNQLTLPKDNDQHEVCFRAREFVHSPPYIDTSQNPHQENSDLLTPDHEDSTSSSRSTSPHFSENEMNMDQLESVPDYGEKIKRAVKLGYTEKQLKMALRKLGANADSNQLLQEMIKLGSAAKPDDDSLMSPTRTDPNTSPKRDSGDSFVGVTKEFVDDSSNLRHIVIDGSNLAMSHGKDIFSCRGIQLAVEWFQQRGHKKITVFVPGWRKESSRPDAPIKDQEILTMLEKEKILVYTPSRRVAGRRVVCYDDRYILNLAVDADGIVVSNDNYRDLLNEKPEYKKVIEERLLMYSFAEDRFMPPEDPLGRIGPTLDNFLRKEPTVPEPLPPECPYGKKCTYGNKCRYYHPERRNMPHKFVTEKLAEHAKQEMQEREAKIAEENSEKKKQRDSSKKGLKKMPLMRTQSVVPAEFLASGDLFGGGGDKLVGEAKPRPDKTAAEKQNYNEKLDEHRKKLQKALELSEKADSDAKETWNGTALNSNVQLQEKACGSGGDRNSPVIVVRNSGFSSPTSQLKVPEVRTKKQENLVSGHLLVAKKLSDEAQDSSFFKDHGTRNCDLPEEPVGSVSWYPQTAQDSSDLHNNLNRQLSLKGNDDPHFVQQTSRPRPHYTDQGNPQSVQSSDDRFIQQPLRFRTHNLDNVESMQYYSGPSVSHQYAVNKDMRYVSGTGEHCQSFPFTDKEIGTRHQGQKNKSNLTDRTFFISDASDSNSPFSDHPFLTRLQSAPEHIGQLQGPSRHGSMVRQNSSSDPQINMAGLQAEQSENQVSVGPAPYSESDRYAVSHHHIIRHPINRSTSVQQAVYAPRYMDRQISEVHSTATDRMHGGHQHQFYDFGSRYVPVEFPPFYNPSGQFAQTPSGGQNSLFGMWSGNMPSSPSPQSYQHQQQPIQSPLRVHSPHQFLSPSHQVMSPGSLSYPPDTAILPTDCRYPLYYNLSGVFPEPKVRAVMNRYPEEKDPSIICTYIMHAE